MIELACVAIILYIFCVFAIVLLFVIMQKLFLIFLTVS